ncbi:pyridoxal-phosphate dependent enzyme [Halobacteriales archaeon Cl-PHB]
METTETLTGLRCADCGGEFGPAEASNRCPDCDGRLEATYDLGGVDLTPEDLEPDASTGLATYEPLLPFPAEALPATGAGATPLVAAPTLADEVGVASVAVKDESANPTGGIVDREMAVAVAAVDQAGASDVALPTMGNAGQAAAAAAARLGLASHSFVPTRTPFVNKAMINVHGGDMSVVEGRYEDAAGAFEGAMADEDWHSLAAFETPYRQEGAKTVAHELLAQRDSTLPDAVVVPTGHGVGIVGLHRGFRELQELGLVDDLPRLFAAQAGGCAPLARAWEAGEATPQPIDHPDTICGPLEIPDPAGGDLALAALEASDGAAVGTPDEAILEGATSLAEEGVPTSVTGGAAVSGLEALADQGAFDAGDDVVLVNPLSGNKEADLLRSHLMGKGL